MAIPGISGNARLGIPKVNPNPQPPQQAAVKAAIGNRVAAPAGRPQSAKVGVAPARPVTPPRVAPQPVKVNPALAGVQAATQPTPAPTPGTPAPTEPTLPVAPAAPGAPKSPYEVMPWTGTGPDPQDATYWANIAKLQSQDLQEEAKINFEGTSAAANYNLALQTAIQNRALQERSLGESAIKGNLGSSGWLNRNETEQTQAYTAERAKAELNKSQEEQARNMDIQDMRENFGLSNVGELAAGGERAGALAREEAKGDEPELPAPVAPAAPAPKTSKPKPNPKKQALANRKKAGK